MMKKLLLTAVMTSAILCLTAQRTTRKVEVPDLTAVDTVPTQIALPELTPMVNPEPHIFDVSGYDKPLRSRRETFFVTNNADGTIYGMAVTFNYTDVRGNQLHKRTQHINAEIPAGQTRQVAIPSWDKQFSFYYRRSAVPQRATNATPYDVAITVDTLYIAQ